MRTLARSTRGVSPIIATVLLIAFALVLGATIMMSNKLFVQRVQDKTEDYEGRLSCSTDVDVQIVKACFQKDPSGEFGLINLFVENRRSTLVNGEFFWLRIRQGTSSNFQYGEGIIKPAETKQMNVPYNAIYGDPESISLIPIIKRDNKDYLCTDSAKDVEVKPC